MKTIELSSESLSLRELLAIAHDEPVLIRTAAGEEFVLGAVDDFEREVELLRASPELAEFLAERQKERGTTSLDEVKASLRD